MTELPTLLPPRLTTWQLANLADCASPDRGDGIGVHPRPETMPEPSPGAEMLRQVEDAYREAVEYAGDVCEWDEDDGPSEIANGVPSPHTYEMWRQFTDLGAWTEDPSELGFEGSEMDEGAGICLYMIAERLTLALHAALVEWTDEHFPAPGRCETCGVLTADYEAHDADDAECLPDGGHDWTTLTPSEYLELADVSGPRIRHLTPLTPAEVDAIGSHRLNRERAIERVLDQ